MEYLESCILEMRKRKHLARVTATRNEQFFDGLFEMPVPENFVDMPTEMVRTRFMTEEIPAYIKMVNEGELIMSMDLLEGNGTVREELEKSMRILKCLYPDDVVYEEGELKDMGGWFEIKSYWEEETYYQLYFMTEKEEYKMFGKFQCKFEIYDKWKPQILQMISQIR